MALLVVSGILTVASNYLSLPLVTAGLFFFSAGLATAALSWKPSTKLAAASLALTFMAMLACVLSPWKGVLLTGAHPGPLHIYNGLANEILALIALPLALFTTRQKSDGKDSVFGELSYIVYLLHWIFIENFRPPKSYALRAVEEGVMVLVVVAISYVILRLFDKPMNERRSSWVRGRILKPVSV
uniref:Acyltransferase 3 domain-containing protein n=1 Tax=Acidobacterium capsulatum TaxID=33075 RepID=A0A7V5CTV6_9BACT